jgi:3-hydroxyisobutyrate dehydrogenase-like beta-hydroxyacid dehydrogenase
MTRVGFVGAGAMGEPMVERLLAVGHEVHVHARRADVRERLTERGAVVTGQAADAAAEAEVFLSCLFSDPQLLEVGPAVVDALPSGAVLASHTTGSADLLRQLADQGRSRGVSVVDAPVSGTDTDIRAGQLTVLLGGESAAVELVADVVRAYADPVLLTGGLGSALAVKLVNNLLFAAHVQLGAAAVNLGSRLGIPTQQLFEALGHMSGGSTALRYMAATGSAEEFGRRVAHFLHKDVAACEDAARERDVDPGLLLDVVRRGPLSVVGTA